MKMVLKFAPETENKAVNPLSCEWLSLSLPDIILCVTNDYLSVECSGLCLSVNLSVSPRTCNNLPFCFLHRHEVFDMSSNSAWEKPQHEKRMLKNKSNTVWWSNVVGVQIAINDYQIYGSIINVWMQMLSICFNHCINYFSSPSCLIDQLLPESTLFLHIVLCKYDFNLLIVQADLKKPEVKILEADCLNYIL